MLAQGKTLKVAAVAGDSKSRLSALSKGDGGTNPELVEGNHRVTRPVRVHF